MQLKPPAPARCRPIFLYDLARGGTVCHVSEQPFPQPGPMLTLLRRFEVQGPPGTALDVPGTGGPIALDAQGRAAFTLEITW